MRAMMADGTQAWAWPTFAAPVAGANDGGLLAITNNPDNSASFLSMLNPDMSMRWQTPMRSTDGSVSIYDPRYRHAITADGTIYVARLTRAGDQSTTALVGFDSGTGAENSNWWLPYTTRDYSGGYYWTNSQGVLRFVCDGQDISGVTTGQHQKLASQRVSPVIGEIVADASGTPFLPFAVANSSYGVNCEFEPATNPDGSSNLDSDSLLKAKVWHYTYSNTSTVGLMRGGSAQYLSQVADSGGSDETSLTFNSRNWPGPNQYFSVDNGIVPDGNGGVYFAGEYRDQFFNLHYGYFDSAGAFTDTPVGSINQMIRDSSGAVILQGSTGITPMAGGWITGRGDLLGTLDDGSIAVSLLGIPTKIDPAGGTYQFTGGVALDPAQYYVAGLWAGAEADGSLGLVVGTAAIDQADTWAEAGGNPLQTNAELAGCPCLLQYADGDGTAAMATQSKPPSSLQLSSAQPDPLDLLVAGDPGLNEPGCGQPHHPDCHKVGSMFNLAAATRAGELSNPLWDQANQRPYFRASSVEDFDNEMNFSAESITGEVVLFGHSGRVQRGSRLLSAFFIGENHEVPGSTPHPNLYSDTVSLLHNSHLGPNVTIRLNGCHAGLGGGWSIAQQVADQLQRRVFAYPVPMFFSKDKTTKASPLAPRKFGTSGPIYMLPEGGGNPIKFCPGGGKQC